MGLCDEEKKEPMLQAAWAFRLFDRSTRDSGRAYSYERYSLLYAVTDSGISALCETLCTSSLSSSASISLSKRCAISASTAIVLVGRCVISAASIAMFAAVMASLTFKNWVGDVITSSTSPSLVT